MYNLQGLKDVPNYSVILKAGNRLSFNFDIMVTGNRFFQDISKIIITVNRLKTVGKVFGNRPPV